MTKVKIYYKILKFEDGYTQKIGAYKNKSI